MNVNAEIIAILKDDLTYKGLRIRQILLNQAIQEIDLSKHKLTKNDLSILSIGLQYSHVTKVNLSQCVEVESDLLALNFKNTPITHMIIRNNDLEFLEANAVSNFFLNLPNLKHLDLSNNHLQNLEVLSKFLPTTLETLSLKKCALSMESAELLGEFIARTKLCHLNLQANFFHYAWVEKFSNFIPHSHLISLNLGNNSLNFDSIMRIATTLENGLIQNLDISQNRFAITHLLDDTEALEEVDNVQLQGKANKIKALAETLSKSKVSKLNLSWTHLQSEDILNLKSVLSNLTELNLSNNTNLGRIGIETLASILSLSKIKNLNLSLCNMNNYVAVVLAKNLKHTAIESLNMGYNRISDVGIQAICQNLPSTIRVLKFSHSHIGIRDNWNYKTITAIMQVVNNFKLNRLDLDFNDLDDIHLSIIIEYLRKPNVLKQLNLSGNKISESGILFFLQDVLNYVKLQSLDVSAIKELFSNTSEHTIVELLENTHLIDFKCADYGKEEKAQFQKICENNLKKWGNNPMALGPSITHSYNNSILNKPNFCAVKERTIAFIKPS